MWTRLLHCTMQIYLQVIKVWQKCISPWKTNSSFLVWCIYLRCFIKGCHICQLARPDKPPMRQLQTPNLFELQTIIKVKYGSEGDAKIAKGSLIYIVHHWWNDKLFNHCPHLSFKIRGSRSFNRTCYIQVLCSQLHYHGPR